MTRDLGPEDEGRIPVVVLGATGSVGQRFVSLLERHPWFEVVGLTASERSAGRTYGEAVEWAQETPIPPRVRTMVVRRTAPPLPAQIVFSALDAAVAGPVETALAREGHVVVSNARNHRMDLGTPLLVPEINADHLELLVTQGFYGGAIVTNPNCSTIGIALALKPLFDAFGLEAVHAVTLQAVSGAGLRGVDPADIDGNVIPFISGEEEKIERETLKILGSLGEGQIDAANFPVGAQCTRVPVADGHTACVSVRLGQAATPEEVREAWETFAGPPQRLGLPSAPRRPVHYIEGEANPQPRLHRDLEGGMAIAVGRLRPCPILDYRFVTVSHNTIRGAAGGAILCAELMLARGDVAGLNPPALAGHRASAAGDSA
jgi:aspartate-semialdehyde dehydrogenase